MPDNTPSRENRCPHDHETFAEGMRCAQRNLGVEPGQKLQPYWGTTSQNAGLNVGWQLSPRRRWRLDYDKVKGPHINEENYDLPAHLAKTVHFLPKAALSGEYMVWLQWRKWTSAGNVEK